MGRSKYIHGYARSEQDRLVAQAAYWKDLILRNLDYKSGEKVLEIGCGVGAVLGLIGNRFPEVMLSGIDVAPAQIEYARRYLPTVGVREAELRVGDASSLPWQDSTFDHVFIIWVIEHLRNPGEVLREANRVLRPGGSITVTETDYSTISTYPASADYDLFMKSFIGYFNRHGDAYAGRKLGCILEESGFTGVANEVIGLNYWHGSRSRELARHIDYLSEFIEPVLGELANAADVEPERIEKGFACFRSMKEAKSGAISHMFYRGTGYKP